MGACGGGADVAGDGDAALRREATAMKVELKIPKNVWEALKLVAARFDETPDEWALHYIKGGLFGDALDSFATEPHPYFEPLSRKVVELLKGSEDPCEDCVVEPGSPDCETCFYNPEKT